MSFQCSCIMCNSSQQLLLTLLEIFPLGFIYAFRHNCAWRCFFFLSHWVAVQHSFADRLQDERRRRCFHVFLTCLSIRETSVSRVICVIRPRCFGEPMAFPLPVWLAVQEELLGHGDSADCGAPCCFDDFDDEALFRMFHLTRPCITFITDAIRIRMRMAGSEPAPLSVDAMVMLALNHYAHGVSSSEVLQRLGLSHTELAVVVISTVSEVIAGMTDQFISFPQTRDARANVALKAEKICGIPNVLGVLAPAHFKIRASPYRHEKNTFRSFVNCLGYSSVVSQIICDCDGNLLSVEHCCVGSTKEQEMWESSFKGREMENDLHGQYWVIGGKGYHLSEHVLTPVSKPKMDNEIRFNVAHTKMHNIMRTTLGSMKRRFRCLMQLGFAQEASLNKKSNIIKACCVLHNIAKKFSVPPPPIAGKLEPLHPGKHHSVTSEVNPEALKARQKLIDVNFS